MAGRSSTTRRRHASTEARGTGQPPPSRPSKRHRGQRPIPMRAVASGPVVASAHGTPAVDGLKPLPLPPLPLPAVSHATREPRSRTSWRRSNPKFMQGSCATACCRLAARRAAAKRGEGRLDWYLFARGLDFKGAIADYTKLGGAQPLPPRYAFGVWFSRWWPLSDWESTALVQEFEDQGVPLDVLVTDMDWHPTCYRRTFGSDREKSMDASNNWPCWSSFTWDRKHFNHPEAFLGWCKARGVHNALNLHFQSGLQGEEERFDEFRSALGLPRHAKYAAFDPLNQTYSREFHRVVLRPLEGMGVDLWWLDWQQGEQLFAGTDTPTVNPTFWLNYVYYTQPDGRVPLDNIASVRGSQRRRRLIMH
eukprot:2212486-Prymnesium_polylepis.1